MTTLPLKGKNGSHRNAIVLSASKGIGLATARCLYESGHLVFLNSRNRRNLEQARRKLFHSSGRGEGQIVLAPFDINDIRASKIGLKKIIKASQGKIDVLVTNAVDIQNVDRTSGDKKRNDWERIISSHFRSMIRIIEIIAPFMMSNNRGRIVNISTQAIREPLMGYSSSVGVRSMFSVYLKSLSDRLAAHNITVNEVLCGFVQTDRLDNSISRKAKGRKMSKKKLTDEIVTKIPMHRFATPDEIGSVVRFLVSDDASYITGQGIIVDGGLTRTAF